LRTLESYHWPGNVRELENILHREYLLSDDDLLRVRPLNFAPGGARLAEPTRKAPEEAAPVEFSRAKAHAIRQFERAYLVDALQRHGGNVSRAARSSGKERRAFGKLMKKYGIDRGCEAAEAAMPETL